MAPACARARLFSASTQNRPLESTGRFNPTSCLLCSKRPQRILGFANIACIFATGAAPTDAKPRHTKKTATHNRFMPATLPISRTAPAARQNTSRHSPVATATCVVLARESRRPVMVSVIKYWILRRFSHSTISARNFSRCPKVAELRNEFAYRSPAKHSRRLSSAA